MHAHPSQQARRGSVPASAQYPLEQLQAVYLSQAGMQCQVVQIPLRTVTQRLQQKHFAVAGPAGSCCQVQEHLTVTVLSLC